VTRALYCGVPAAIISPSDSSLRPLRWLWTVDLAGSASRLASDRAAVADRVHHILNRPNDDGGFEEVDLVTGTGDDPLGPIR